MNIYTTRSINIISLIITVIIFLVFELIFDANKKEYASVNIENNEIEGSINRYNPEENANDYNWYIEIDSISLKAPIAETTNMDILSKYVGHFEETSTTTGNIGLAAHNRGYEINYFENLKSVKKGDEITYKYNDFEMTYIVDTIEIIEETDWSYFVNQEKNKITLITCVENEPKFRRCVQASEKQ